MSIKPILFDAEMVRAILNGRKTCTRRIVKGYIPPDGEFGYTAFTPQNAISCRGTFETSYPRYGEKFFKLPYQKGDVLYVRETWGWCPCWDCGLDTTPDGCKNPVIYDFKKKEHGCYMYRASCEDSKYSLADTWHPSIHMPKEAARIFLKITNVKAERLQDIDIDGIRNEGLLSAAVHCEDMEIALKEWEILWNSTIKKSDLDRYGWDANPYVWVIEFERRDGMYFKKL